MNKAPGSNKNLPSPFIIEIVRILTISVSKVFWRIKFRNTHNIPQSLKSGLVVAANHQTYFDPFWICVPIKRRFRFMAWDVAFDWFIIGKLIRRLGAFPVSLKKGGSIRAMKDALEFLRNGDTLIIFPEGEREFSEGKQLKFRSGAVRIATEANVPILPVTIRGANRVWSQDHKLPSFGRVEIIYHPILKTSENKNLKGKSDQLADLNNQLTKIIASAQRDIL